MTVQRKLKSEILSFIDKSIPATEFDCPEPKRARRPMLAACLGVLAFAVASASAFGVYFAFSADGRGHTEQRMNRGGLGEPVEYRGGEMTLLDALLLPERRFELRFQTTVPCSEEDARCARCSVLVLWYFAEMGIKDGDPVLFDSSLEVTTTGPMDFTVVSALPVGVWDWISSAIDAGWDKERYAVGPGGSVWIDFPLKSDAEHDYETDPSTTIPTFEVTFNYFKKGLNL